jgi:hypothetical protein
MKTYLLVVTTQIEVAAPDLSDARDLVNEYFGDGSFGDLEVVSHEILDEEEIS